MGQCFLSVAQRNIRGVNTPWLMWFYCGYIDEPTWCDHVGQLLVCVGEDNVRPSVARPVRCLTRRGRGADDLTAVSNWQGPVLDATAPVYVIPPANMITWWYPHTFDVRSTKKAGQFHVRGKTIKRMQSTDSAIFCRILT